jgi:hypothetical protein
MIYTGLKYQGKTPLDYQYTFNFKNKSFLRVGIIGRGGQKERGNEGIYGGCIFVSIYENQMKLVEIVPRSREGGRKKNKELKNKDL